MRDEVDQLRCVWRQAQDREAARRQEVIATASLPEVTACHDDLRSLEGRVDDQRRVDLPVNDEAGGALAGEPARSTAGQGRRVSSVELVPQVQIQPGLVE